MWLEPAPSGDALSETHGRVSAVACGNVRQSEIVPCRYWISAMGTIVAILLRLSPHSGLGEGPSTIRVEIKIVRLSLFGSVSGIRVQLIRAAQERARLPIW